MKNIIALIVVMSLSSNIIAQNIIAGEYFFDTKMNYGQGIPIPIVNPANIVELTSSLPVDLLPQGLHRLFVRFQDSNGVWTQTESFPVFIKREEMLTLLRGEYFFDEKVAYGNGTALDLSVQSNITEVLESIPVEDLSEGFHRLFVRFEDNHQHWSQTLSFSVFIKREQLILITGGEYFFDTLVEFGEGIPMEVDSISMATTLSDFIVAPISLPAGNHTLYYRFKDDDEKWSHTYSEEVCVNIIDGEYKVSDDIYCLGDSVLFNYSGSIGSQVYEWDLDNDGSFDDLQTNGESFSFVINNVVDNLAIIPYRLSSNVCIGGFSKIDTLLINYFPEIFIEEEISNLTCNGFCDGMIAITNLGGSPPFDFEWSIG